MTTTIIACIITALIAGTLGCFMSAIVMWAGRNDEMEERCRSCRAQNEEGFAVVIEPNSDVRLMCVTQANVNLVLARMLGNTYRANICRELSITDEIYAFSSTERGNIYNRYASEICHTDLYGDVILMPCENNQYVLWDLAKTDILRCLVCGRIKQIKNREEEIYGADQT